MEKYMTKEQREKLSNRLVYNFGVLLVGALIMLYIYNFIIAGYTQVTLNTVGMVGILCAILAIAFFVLGKLRYPKLKKISPIFLGSFIAALITYSPKFSFIVKLFPQFTAKYAVVAVFILMLLYFIVLAIVTGVTLKTHPLAPSEKKIVHKKKKKKK